VSSRSSVVLASIALVAVTLALLPRVHDAGMRPAGPVRTDADPLRTAAVRGDAHAQLALALRLGEAAADGPGGARLREAAEWAERAWSSDRGVAPDALLAFVRAHCAHPAIALHPVCTEGE
jgi:hypothetical protein